MSDVPVVTLFSSGLLSKWGFNDGDAPDDVLDWCEDQGLGWRIEWRSVILPRLVREWLLPALGQDVTVCEISTNHNPVRARTVDGADAERFWHGGHEGEEPRLTPEFVEIPMTEVARIIAEAAA